MPMSNESSSEPASLKATLEPTLLDVAAKITHADGLPVQDSHMSTTAKKEGDGPGHLAREYYLPFLSEQSKKRKPNAIRDLYPLEKKPGIISLLAGKPNPTTFPITNIEVTVRAPPNADGSASGGELKVDVSGQPLADGLQYCDTAGWRPFLDWIEGLQKIAHRRMKTDDWMVAVGSGSQDLLYKAFHALLDPRDSVLVETPVYSGVLPLCDALDCDITAIETDAFGISTTALREALENWPSSKPAPKFLYTVPFGCNPTGMTASIERRREVLELARKYNFLILEDDPYFYLYYGKAAKPQSYFELEAYEPERGRVLRFDSMSKVLAAGIRIGFVTGPVPIIQAMLIHTSQANLQTSSLTQVITYEIFKAYGYEGFFRHAAMVSDFYRAKRDVFDIAMHRHLDGLAQWDTPEAGMFFWFKLLLDSPDPTGLSDGQRGEEDSEDIIRNKAFANGVLALPGTSFLAGGGKTAYVRASFSCNPPEDVEEALRRLRETVLQDRKERKRA